MTMKTLGVSSLFPFEDIPLWLGKSRALMALQTRVVPIIQEDIRSVVDAGLKEFESAEMIQALQQLGQAIHGLPQSIVRSSLEQQMRFFVLVVQNRLDDAEEPAPLRDKCAEMIRVFGAVPVLNETVPLPALEFLPSQYVDSAARWATIIWKNPSRDAAKEKIGFFDKRQADGRIASVRLHLIDLDGDDRETGEALSYADADFYAIGNLQADHLQPSENIIYRQLELITAMNIDPILRQAMLDQGKDKGYFIETAAGCFGSKLFFMEYHNCIGNLWFVSTAYGGQKSNRDPIEWFAQQERFGDKFFDAVGGRESINKANILYTSQEGVLLADVARQWFRESYGQEITVAGYVARQIKQPMLARAQKVERRGMKREGVKLMASMVTAEGLLEGDSDASADSGHNSSLASSDAAITPRNLGRMKEVAAEQLPAVKEKVHDAFQGYLEVAKRSRKQGAGKKEIEDKSTREFGFGTGGK